MDGPGQRCREGEDGLAGVRAKKNGLKRMLMSKCEHSTSSLSLPAEPYARTHCGICGSDLHTLRSEWVCFDFPLFKFFDYL